MDHRSMTPSEWDRAAETITEVEVVHHLLTVRDPELFQWITEAPLQSIRYWIYAAKRGGETLEQIYGHVLAGD
jgi:hypothetical protein